MCGYLGFRVWAEFVLGHLLKSLQMFGGLLLSPGIHDW